MSIFAPRLTFSGISLNWGRSESIRQVRFTFSMFSEKKEAIKDSSYDLILLSRSSTAPNRVDCLLATIFDSDNEVGSSPDGNDDIHRH